MPVSITCERCNEDFEVSPSRKDTARFCSIECRRNRVTLSCDFCGVEFEKKASRVTERNYCSRECYGVGQRSRVLKECHQCGEDFETTPSGKQKFCDWECARRHYEQNSSRITLTCEVCSAEYERDPSLADDSKYCSRECQHEAQRTGEVQECEGCGEQFYRPPSASGKYCSAACYRETHEYKVGPENPCWNRVECTCEICGATFYKNPSTVDKGFGRFCSIDCRSDWMRSVTGSDHWHSKPRVELECEWCGATFKVKPARVERARFCSRQCQGAYSTSQQGGRRSSLERAVEAELEALGIRYVPQKRVGRWSVDFYLPDGRIVIECDGVYWHSLPEVIERDKRKDKYLKSKGYTVHRIGGDAIREDTRKAVRSTLEVI